MNIDAGTLVLIAAGCSILCVVLFVLGTVLNAIGTVFEVASSLFEIAVGLFNTGPLPGCGCVMAALVLAMCIGGGMALSSITSSCGTPQQMNFCRLLGY